MKIICDWENCKELGKYKAPVEKDNSRNYRLLCLNHIKIFNKKWNYFENMNESEIEFFLKSDITWHKKTKKFGSQDNFFNVLFIIFARLGPITSSFKTISSSAFTASPK